jgi:hypothetical protein
VIVQSDESVSPQFMLEKLQVVRISLFYLHICISSTSLSQISLFYVFLSGVQRVENLLNLRNLKKEKRVILRDSIVFNF